MVTDGVTQLTAYGQINLANLISSQLPDAAANIDGWINVNYNFLGLNLATNPWDAVTHFTLSWATIGLILIPLIAGGSPVPHDQVHDQDPAHSRGPRRPVPPR